MKTLSWITLSSVSFLTFCISFPAIAQGFRLVSAADASRRSPSGGGGDSYAPVISPDGRFVLFSSTANNLVQVSSGLPLPALNPSTLNVFLRDRANGTTTLVSVNSAGTGGGDRDSLPVGVSTNGRFAMFESSAGNLVPGDTNKTSDIFVRDLAAGATILVSVASNGGSGNGPSQSAAMTPDGRYVTFLSGATNIVPGDTNGIPDVFLRDLQTATTTWVTAWVPSLGLLYQFPLDTPPIITPDGRYVVYQHKATNLVSGNITGDDIYVYDSTLGTTILASGAALEAVHAAYGATNVICFNYKVSNDGQFVAFEASPGSGWAGVVLRYNVLTDVTEVIHTNAAVTTPDSQALDMTPDGRFIAFLANTNGPAGGDSSVLVWDAQTDATVLASGNTNGIVPTNSMCLWPGITPDGRFVSFLSSAPGLVTNGLAGDYHVYVRDLASGTVTLADADTNGAGSLLNSLPVPTLSADGRFIGFEAPDGGVVAGDHNRCYDVLLRDLANGSAEMISAHDPALPSLTPHGSSAHTLYSVSADGRFIAYAGDADDLVANDTNQLRDVFVRDMVLGTNYLVSVAADGITPGAGVSSEPSISANGRYVAFTSSATNLVPAKTNVSQDVFVRDLLAGTTYLVSINTAGTGPGNAPSFSPTLSADGRYVLFSSSAANLAPGTFAYVNAFLRDLQTGETWALTTGGSSIPSMTPDGRFVAYVEGGTTPKLYVWDTQASVRVHTNSVAFFDTVSIGPDGTRVVYWAAGGASLPSLYGVDLVANTQRLITTGYIAGRPGLRFSSGSRLLVYSGHPVSAGPVTNQVYIHDFQTGTNLLVSRNWTTGNPGNSNSDSPDISSDGRFITYRSDATDLVPGDNNGTPDIFLFDRLTAETRLVTVSRLGKSSADNRSLIPVFSADGRTLVFESWASDLAAGDFNLGSDVFALSLFSTDPITTFSASMSFNGQSCLLTWPTLPGKSYRVQFKNDLSDPNWQDVNGTVAVVGSMGYLRDIQPSPSQRMYRVVAF